MVVERYENTIPSVRVSQIKSGRVILRKGSSRASLIAPGASQPVQPSGQQWIDLTRPPRHLRTAAYLRIAVVIHFGERMSVSRPVA